MVKSSRPRTDFVQLPPTSITVPHPMAFSQEMAAVLNLIHANESWIVESVEPGELLRKLFGDIWPSVSDALRQATSVSELILALKQDRAILRWMADSVGGNPGLSRRIKYGPVFGAIYRACFFERHGTVFETTRTLDELLRGSDIAPSTPIGYVRAPFDAIYIRFSEGGRGIPQPCEADGMSYLDGAYVFSVGTEDAPRLYFGFTSRPMVPDHGFSIIQDLPIELRETIGGETLADTVGVLARSGSPSSDPSLQAVLAHTIKVLLYIGSNEARMLHRNERTAVAAMPVGKGLKNKMRRGRALSVAYDRIVIGPSEDDGI